MSPLEVLLLAVAGLAAGSINAVAGGGSLVSFPAMLAVGLPPLAANVTNSVAIWPGYVGTAWGYRRELASQRRRLLALAPAAVTGAGLGCVLLLVTSPEAFERVVPFLVLLGSLLLAVQGRITDRVRTWRGAGRGARSPQLHVSVLLAAAYGAYFGGGLGVVLLACLGLFLVDDLQRLNAVKSALALVINAVALVAFVLFGPVDWAAVGIVAPAALLGGYLGARLARRLDPGRLRAVVVVFGLVVGVALLF
ncbi:MAG: permease [Frankiales bacterium]|nr:permease [Frankiales bacterium]